MALTIQSESQRKQAIYWNLLSVVSNSQTTPLTPVCQEIAKSVGLPQELITPKTSTSKLLQKYPHLQTEFDNVFEVDDLSPDACTRRALVLSKLLMNLNSESGDSSVSAQEFQQWQQDCQQLEDALPEAGNEAGSPQDSSTDNENSEGAGASLDPSPEIQPDFGQIQAQVREALQRIEKDLIERMEILEMLKDDDLARQVQPSIAMVEKLLHLRNKLDEDLLRNAKALIKKFVDQLAEVLKLHFKQSSSPKIDPRIPPQKVFRNLDVWKTVWKNLTNWDPQSQKLYVERFFFKHNVKKNPPKNLILVVDQSGSMTEAMVNAVVLISVFAGVSEDQYRTKLLAFDTKVLDLTPYIRDPFEALLQTRLGGGTDIYQALSVAYSSVEDPENTLIALISDFYEGGSDDRLLGLISAIIESKARFLPIGAVTTARYPQVNPWFKKQLKTLGTPVFSGTPEKLIDELRKSL